MSRKYELRHYQKEASDKAIEFFTSKKEGNAIIVASTGSGKSLLIADIAYRLKGNVVVFCPSKEIVEQNYEKMCSYGVECSMYSASVGQKVISPITFATIGSAIKHVEEFKVFDYILVDECHTCNPKKGMYKKMFKALGKQILGLTASPYRLESEVEMNWATKTFTGAKSYLKMLTDYKKAIFTDIIYNIETRFLIDNGYLSKLRYFNIPPRGWNTDRLFKNPNGSDYSEKAVQWMQDKVGFFDYMVRIIERLMHPLDGKPRNGILVFVKFKKDSEALCKAFGGLCVEISGDTPKKQREKILSDFKEGKIKILTNVNVLTTGFDYPALDTILLARPTMSLSLYYQAIGRALRISSDKSEGWIVDIVDNYNKFGDVADLHLRQNEKKQWNIYNKDRQLTNTYL